MNRMKLGTVLCAFAVTTSGACASAPPRELVDARQAYQRAEKSGASELARGHLDAARKALDEAEATFKDEGVDPKTTDSAYVAGRLAEVAEARATAARSLKAKDRDERRLEVAEAQSNKKTAEELSRTREQLAKTEGERRVGSEALENERERGAVERQRSQETGDQLAIEREARGAAEKEAAAATLAAREAKEKLEKVATVKEDSRGTVISLSGEVLFTTGTAKLRSGALSRLASVAEALKTSNQDILIEGHTDGIGSEDSNQSLSERRAEAVADYLIQRGMPAERVRTIGYGKNRPIADNSTPEGRANNRRVEIVVKDHAS